MKTLLKVIKDLWQDEFLFKGFLTYGLGISAAFVAYWIYDGDYQTPWYLAGLYVFVLLAMIIGTWISDRKKY